MSSFGKEVTNKRKVKPFKILKLKSYQETFIALTDLEDIISKEKVWTIEQFTNPMQKIHTMMISTMYKYITKNMNHNSCKDLL